jgi:hypothetical protein
MLKPNMYGVLKKVGVAIPDAWLAVGEVNLRAVKLLE